MPALTAIAPTILSVLFVVAGVAKVTRPRTATSDVRVLGGPQWLDQRWIELVHGPGEIAIGVLLLVTSGVAQIVMAVAALAICVAYLLLVANAARTRPGAECHCFGRLRTDRVTSRTVWRNAWLVVLALTAVATALAGHSAREWLLDSGAWNALVAAGVATITLWLVLGHDKGDIYASGAGASVAQVDLDDYIRCRTPAVPLDMADGTRTTLREISRSRAQLLLAVSPTCGACENTLKELPRWRNAIPQVDIRLLLADAPEDSSFTSTREPQTVHDLHGYARESLGMLVGFPAAVLLGADGSLAGGPVLGTDAVAEFVAGIQHELDSDTA